MAASWWNDSQFEFRAIAASGFDELVRGWIDDIRTAVEGEDEAASTADPFEHKLIRKLLPEYLAELEEATARKAELDAKVKAATAKDEEEEGEEATDKEEISEEELRQLKKELTAARKKVKQLEEELLQRLEAANDSPVVGGSTGAGAGTGTRSAGRATGAVRLGAPAADRRVRRRAVGQVPRGMRDIEAERDAATAGAGQVHEGAGICT